MLGARAVILLRISAIRGYSYGDDLRGLFAGDYRLLESLSLLGEGQLREFIDEDVRLLLGEFKFRHNLWHLRRCCWICVTAKCILEHIFLIFLNLVWHLSLARI